MMIMLRSTRLCVYNKVLVPFEAYFVSKDFFGGQRQKRESYFFFTWCYFRVSSSKRRFFYTHTHPKVSPQKTRGRRSFAFARAREYTRIIAQRRTRSETSAHLISRASFNSLASNTRGACVARSRRKTKKTRQRTLSLLRVNP